MRSTRVKLAFIAALGVALAMAAATIAFNLFINWKIESDAVGDIEYALSWDSDVAGAGRVPGSIILDASYEIDSSMRRWSAPEEIELAAWFAQHPIEGVVSRVILDDWACYAAMVPYDEYYPDYEQDKFAGYDREASFGGWTEPSYLVAYIDITAEQSLIAAVNATFAAIAILGAIIAAASGYTAGRRIEQAQEAQKHFYENMSHDLKTPLAAIRGYAEGARDGVVDPDDAMHAIERASSKMTGMIDEILGLSRLEAGATQLHRETIDVGDFIQDCLMPFEGAVRAKGLNVDLDLESGTVEADSNLFDHALSNIFSNAIRHAANEIRITYDGTTIRVINDGAMPTEDQVAHFFDRFYSGEGGSTGIGLAFTHEIATAHGWSVSAAIESSHFVISMILA